MDKDKEKSSSAPVLNFNPNLNTKWIDVFNIGVRGDNLVLIRFLTNLPEGNFEQSRIMTGKEQLKKFIDITCSLLDYYPSKKQKVIRAKKGDAL